MPWKRVAKEELIAFVKSYRGELESDVCTVAEPPLVQYNDWNRGAWPNSVVAQHDSEGGYWLLEENND